MDEAKNFQKKTSEMGFVNVALIIYLPVVVAVLACLSILLSTIYQKTGADRICKSEALRLQKQLGTLLTDLIKLNKVAKHPRLDRAAADHGVDVAEASGEPPLIEAALAVQQAVIEAQIIFSAKQNAILEAAKTLRVKSATALANSQTRFGILKSTLDPNGSTGLAVAPTPVMSLTPDYVPTTDFYERQSSTFRYSQNILLTLPTWLQTFSLGKVRLDNLLAQCSATLTEREDKWAPVLKMAKR
jgi:hypothetical protein